MRFYGVTFFPYGDKDEPLCPECRIRNDGSVHIVSESEGWYSSPKISFLSMTDLQIIKFKNSVLWAYEKWLKEKKEVKDEMEV